MKSIIAFFHFWYDFLIGDSWQIALGVIIVTVVTGMVVTQLPATTEIMGPVFFLALVAVFSGVILFEQR